MAKAKDKPRTCLTCPWRNAYPVYDGKRYACHLTGHNVHPEQPCVLKVSDALFEALEFDGVKNEDN